MKDIPKSKLKTYLVMIFLTVMIFGGVLDILLSASEWDEYIDTLNYASADSTDSGFNFFTDWKDISLGVTGSYEEIDISAYVPAGSTGAIVQMINKDATITGFYARKKGSTDDYYEAQVMWTDCQKMVYVGIDGDLIFEMKISDTDLDAYLIGYMDNTVTMFDDGLDYSIGSASAWTDNDLSASVPSGATGVIIMQYEGGQAFESGSRHPDSTDDFRLAERVFHYQLCGVNSSRMIQNYVDSLTVETYLMGYTTEVHFNINWDDVSLGVTGSWEGIDVTAETSADATGVIIYAMSDSGWVSANIQGDGSTNNQVSDIQLYADGQTWFSCGLNSSQGFEGWISSTDADFYVIGWAEEPPVPSVIYPDSIDSSFNAVNTTHSLFDNETFAVVEKDGWIVWDFAGGTAYNITAIRWELMYAVTHGLWRLSGSNDKIAWYPIAQMTASEVGTPPADSDFNTSTRYDSYIHTNYRYYMIQAVNSVLGNYYIDYICLIPAPPPINYSDGTYIYPIEIEYYNYAPTSFNYRWKPHNMLGKNRTTGSDGGNYSIINPLVNIDDDSDNWAVVKFGDFYNITSVEIYASLQTPALHTYMYVSQYADTGFTLVWDSIGQSETARYYGVTENHTYIRYIKVNCTGISSSAVDILGFRIQGELSGGEGGGPPPLGPDEFSFILLPNYLGDLLGIGTDGGQFLASLIVLSAFLFPIAVYDRKGIIALIVGVAVFGFLVLIGWLPTWLMLMMILLVAGIFAFNWSRWFGGKRS